MNKIFLTGYLGKNPETKRTGDIDFCQFSLGVSKKEKEETKTLWFYCTAWRGISKVIAEHFKKGDKILVAGELDTYESGDGRTSLNVTVTEFDFKKKSEGTPRPPVTSETTKTEPTGNGLKNTPSKNVRMDDINPPDDINSETGDLPF